MAASTSALTQLGLEDLAGPIVEGQKLTEYLFYNAADLDAAVGCRDGLTIQLALNSKLGLGREWIDRIETGNAVFAIKTISEALRSLRVGSMSKDDVMPGYGKLYQIQRNVNDKVFPEGYNIPVVLKQDTSKLLGLPTGRVGRYKAVYNVHDGVIIICSIVRPSGNAAEIHRFSKPCDVIGAMLSTFQTRKAPTSEESKQRCSSAKAIVAKALRERSPLPPLPERIVGSWLFTAIGAQQGITASAIESEMNAWLNYIIAHVQVDNPARVIMQFACGVDLSTLTWENRMTFTVGSILFYCLLGTDLGQDVAWLLAKRKDPKDLGRKVIRSITVFHAKTDTHLSAEENERYATPMLLFEIKDDSQDIRDEWRTQDPVDGMGGSPLLDFTG